MSRIDTRRKLGIVPRLPPDSVTEYLSSDDQGVRAAAVRVLSSDASAQTDGLLLGVLQRDPAAAVRGAAIKALAARPPNEPANTVVAQRLSQGREDVPALRVEIVKFLAARMESFPQNQATLRDHLQREVDWRVILAILGALPTK